jgi:hypothetical protein
MKLLSRKEIRVKKEDEKVRLAKELNILHSAANTKVRQINEAKTEFERQLEELSKQH